MKYLTTAIFALLIIISTSQAVNVSACGYLNGNNTAFTLNQSINISGATCITFNGTNQSLNCNGYSIKGNNTTGTYGIYSTKSQTNVTNCNISGFATAIYYGNLSSGSITSSNASSDLPVANCDTYGDESSCTASGCTSNPAACSYDGICESLGYEDCTGTYNYACYWDGDEFSGTCWLSDGDFCKYESACSSYPEICTETVFSCTGTPASCGYLGNCYGFHLNRSTGCTLSGNRVSGNASSLYLLHSNHTSVSNENYSSSTAFPITSDYSYSVNFSSLNSTGGYNFRLSNAANVRINNLRITTTLSTGAATALKMTYTTNSSVNNSYFNGSDGGLQIDYNSKRINVTNSSFGNGGAYPILVGTGGSNDNISFVGNTVTNITASQTGYYIYGGANILIDCQGKNITGMGSNDLGIAATSTSNLTIQDCNFPQISRAINIYGTTGLVINRTNASGISASYILARIQTGTNEFRVDKSSFHSQNNIAFYIEGLVNGGNITNSTFSGLQGYRTDATTAPNYPRRIRVSNSTFTGNLPYYLGAYTQNVSCDRCIMTVTNTSATLGAVLYIKTHNSTISNSTLTGIAAANGIVFYQGAGYDSLDNVFINNTITANATAIKLFPGAARNTFCWNNVTSNSTYVSDTGGNFYNSTRCGANEGNIWTNVMNGSVNITGTSASAGFPALYVGDAGAGFPYNNSTSAGKLTGNITDWRPLTPTTTSTAPACVYGIIWISPTSTGIKTFN